MTVCEKLGVFSLEPDENASPLQRFYSISHSDQFGYILFLYIT
jgi:hypothetical protein